MIAEADKVDTKQNTDSKRFLKVKEACQ